MSGSRWNARDTWAADTFESLSPAEHMQQAHDEAAQHCFHRVDEIDRFLRQMVSKIGMLEMDLTNSYCPLGCYRDLEMDLGCIAGLKPKVIRILGLRQGEGDRLKSNMAGDMGVSVVELEKGHSLRLNPTDDPWAKWRLEITL